MESDGDEREAVSDSVGPSATCAVQNAMTKEATLFGAPPCVPEEMALTSCRRSCNCKFPKASGMQDQASHTHLRLMAPALRAHGGPQAAVAGVVNAEAQ